MYLGDRQLVVNAQSTMMVISGQIVYLCDTDSHWVGLWTQTEKIMYPVTV